MTFVDDTHLTYAQSLLWVVCIAIVLVGAAGLSLFGAFRHARSAEAARTRRKAPLRKGPITLHGRVRTSDGLPAIKLRIEQTGGERRDKHGRVVMSVWKEVSRELTSHPFELELEGGVRVHVEPGPSPFLIDDLVERGGTVNTRIAQAELSHGERVCIEGVLTQKHLHNGEGDYRGTHAAWVLRPSSTGPMLLSTAFLAVHHMRRARVWRVTGLVCVATLLLSFLAAGSYLPLLLAGAATEVQVTAHRQRAWCGRYACPRFLDMRTASGEVLSEQVSASIYEQLEDGDRVPFLLVPSRPSIHQLGTRATLATQAPLWILLLALVPLGVGWFMHSWNIGWFTQKHVTHVQDAGYHR